MIIDDLKKVCICTCSTDILTCSQKLTDSTHFGCESDKKNYVKQNSRRKIYTEEHVES